MSEPNGRVLARMFPGPYTPQQRNLSAAAAAPAGGGNKVGISHTIVPMNYNC